jgi:DNA-binding CsgD family transcriptional regulator
VLTSFDDNDRLFEALRAGATGYLLKDAAEREVVSSIREVVAGGAPMTPSIARRVVGELRRAPPSADPLTRREREVLELLVKGATYEMIGKALGVATGTVQAHIKSIYRKLEVSTKSEATLEAVRAGSSVDHAGAPGAVGMRAATRTPPLSERSIANEPPALWTRRAMFRSPRPPDRAPSESPQPSSSTTISTAPARAESESRTRRARACFTTLWTASWTTRTVTSRTAGVGGSASSNDVVASSSMEAAAHTSPA